MFRPVEVSQIGVRQADHHEREQEQGYRDRSPGRNLQRQRPERPDAVEAWQAGRWAYYLITDQTGDFSIVDSIASGPALAFSATNRTLLNAVPDEPDAFAMALSRQYSDFQRIRFLSGQPVPCSSAARKGIELRLGGQKVIEAMPNPSVRHLSRIKQKVGAELQDQETFHHVVKYLKAQ